MKKHSVEIGDCFVKPETPRTVWVVQRIVDHPGLPLHARLKSRGLLSRNIVLSVSALVDRSMYQRIERYALSTAPALARSTRRAVTRIWGIHVRG